MLAFTPSGVVSAPTVLHLRVAPAFPGRVRAGAPSPRRALTDAELLDNLRYFTEGLRGPRTQPVARLVLAGVPAARGAGLAAVLDASRRLGIEHVALHAGRDPAHDAASVDALVLGVRDVSDVARVGRVRSAHTDAVLPLDAAGIRGIPALARALAEARPDRVVVTWPFPPAGPPAPPHEARTALDALESALAATGVPWVLKGLPACLAGPHAGRASRSGNRWYVDAEHQREQALRFQPDVLRFFKPEGCRFCAVGRRCDGVAARWWDEGRTGPLRPLERLP